MLLIGNSAEQPIRKEGGNVFVSADTARGEVGITWREDDPEGTYYFTKAQALGFASTIVKNANRLDNPPAAPALAEAGPPTALKLDLAKIAADSADQIIAELCTLTDAEILGAAQRRLFHLGRRGANTINGWRRKEWEFCRRLVAFIAPEARPEPSSASREKHKRIANTCGFFWLPCVLCGRWRGGHEWEDGASVMTHPNGGTGVCERCVQAAEAINRVNEDRWRVDPSLPFIMPDGSPEIPPAPKRDEFTGEILPNNASAI